MLNRLHLIVAVAALAAFGFPAFASAQSAAMAEDEFWAQVESTYSLVVSLDAADPAIRGVLSSEATKYSSITSIQLNNGAVIPVDNSFLVALLQRDPPDFDALKDHLNEMLRRHQSISPNSSEPSNGSSLSEVLSRPEFQWQEERPNPIWEWINRQLRRISRLFPGINTPSGLSPLMLVLGGLVLAALLGFALRGLLTDLVGSAELHNTDDESGLPLSAATALQKAQDTAQTGDYRTAVRYLYLSTLLQLEEHHLLRYDRARTNREYLRSVAHHPELASLLRDVVDVFDRVWYGYQSIDEEAFQTFVARVTELRHYR